MGAACPAMADVNGARYAVSGAVDLPGIENQLVPHAQVSNTNSAAAFADLTAYSVAGVDPSVLLIARTSPDASDPGAFLELWSLVDDPFPVAFCEYMTPDRVAAHDECGVAPGP